MVANDDFSEFPERFKASMEHADKVYSRLPGYYACHYRQPSPAPAGAELVLEDGGIAVFRGKPAAKLSIDGERSPVYALQADGPPAVPTGLVLIRFKEGVALDERLAAIGLAGYEVAHRLAYAPHAAWLSVREGGIAQALAAIPRLEKLPDVENVEPQMLMASVPRR